MNKLNKKNGNLDILTKLCTHNECKSVISSRSRPMLLCGRDSR